MPVLNMDASKWPEAFVHELAKTLARDFNNKICVDGEEGPTRPGKMGPDQYEIRHHLFGSRYFMVGSQELKMKIQTALGLEQQPVVDVTAHPPVTVKDFGDLYPGLTAPDDRMTMVHAPFTTHEAEEATPALRLLLRKEGGAAQLQQAYLIKTITMGQITGFRTVWRPVPIVNEE